MRKLALLGAGSLLLALGAAAVVQRTSTAQQAPAKPDSLTAWVLQPGTPRDLKGPRQPIFFRHDIHAGANKIPCQYCHYSVAESSEPGIPSMQTCMGCHLVIGGTRLQSQGRDQEASRCRYSQEHADRVGPGAYPGAPRALPPHAPHQGLGPTPARPATATSPACRRCSR